MTQTSLGLPNNGQTAHYQFTYDKTFSQADGLNRTTALLGVCEADFTLMETWFQGVKLKYDSPILVEVVNAGGGGHWQGDGPVVTLKPGSNKSVLILRYLLILEVTEMFMASQNRGWYYDQDEGSKGEGLSRFLGVAFQRANSFGFVPPGGFAITSLWLNGSGRPDFVNNNPDDSGLNATNGCTTLFLYYLNMQLGFPIGQIIGAGSGNLSGVYQNLTGFPDGWKPFINLVNQYYPSTLTCVPNGDNIFPVRNLVQFLCPVQITTGYTESAQVVLDGAASAQIVVQITSDNPALLNVPATVTVLVGSSSASVPIQAAAMQSPFSPITVNIHASYAGKNITMPIAVVPPFASSISLAPDVVTCGDSSTATLTLDFPSVLGAVTVDLGSDSGFASVPAQISIPQNHAATTFVVNTPASLLPFPPAHAVIFADSPFSPSATLTVLSKVVAGILDTLTVSPQTISKNSPGRGTVTLLGAVTVDTEVVLEAFDPVITPHGPLPGLGTKSSLVNIPSSVKIPAGGTSGLFTVQVRAAAMQGSKSPVRILARAVVDRVVTVTVTS